MDALGMQDAKDLYVNGKKLENQDGSPAGWLHMNSLVTFDAEAAKEWEEEFKEDIEEAWEESYKEWMKLPRHKRVVMKKSVGQSLIPLMSKNI